MREHQIVITLKPEQFLQVQKLARNAGAKSMGMFVRQQLLVALKLEGQQQSADGNQVEMEPIVSELKRLHGELREFVIESLATYSDSLLGGEESFVVSVEMPTGMPFQVENPAQVETNQAQIESSLRSENPPRVESPVDSESLLHRSFADELEATAEKTFAISPRLGRVETNDEANFERGAGEGNHGRIASGDERETFREQVKIPVRKSELNELDDFPDGPGPDRVPIPWSGLRQTQFRAREQAFQSARKVEVEDASTPTPPASSSASSSAPAPTSAPAPAPAPFITPKSFGSKLSVPAFKFGFSNSNKFSIPDSTPTSSQSSEVTQEPKMSDNLKAPSDPLSGTAGSTPSSVDPLNSVDSTAQVDPLAQKSAQSAAWTKPGSLPGDGLSKTSGAFKSASSNLDSSAKEPPRDPLSELLDQSEIAPAKERSMPANSAEEDDSFDVPLSILARRKQLAAQLRAIQDQPSSEENDPSRSQFANNSATVVPPSKPDKPDLSAESKAQVSTSQKPPEESKKPASQGAGGFLNKYDPLDNSDDDSPFSGGPPPKKR